MSQQATVTVPARNGLRVPAWRLVVRSVAMSTVLVRGGAAVLVAMLLGFLRGGPRLSRRQCYRAMVSILERMGPTFVKFGQTFSPRRDAMPADLADEMASLY